MKLIGLQRQENPNSVFWNSPYFFWKKKKKEKEKVNQIYNIFRILKNYLGTHAFQIFEDWMWVDF